ncbi:MAG: tRNA uridine-5-carboxymethylaminomethyl(34) synthesis GTPase MnmE [Omnitrophica bacterium RIFCSPLOWO2_12_FULL_50_11]|nr:MAG: tRNA uridine-5-carboxymethylaminomethyl(34) synthesis GTPase MnmE [Omnitrophica bacterium RIFCSPLOWO2_12_FULL_50_11]
MPEVHLDDTIAAISTPPGEGGIGIVRLSGPDAVTIVSRMFRSANGTDLMNAKSHTVHFGTICDRQSRIVDQALVSIFRAPKSYTAEEAAEISAHGGRRVLQRILGLALSYGARQAEPGEFTRRAFLNGRMDLAQAEAVLDLIRARTDRSLDVAVKQLRGKLSQEVKAIKDELMTVYVHLEAYLDFPDEHLEVYSNKDFLQKLQQAADQLSALIASYSKGEILREGALVVIVGHPNAGKSSLLNALLDRDRAIVSEIPGTTRDVLEESIELDGLWIRIVDTAGLGRSQDPLDRAGMERTKRYVCEGDLFLWMLDGSLGFLDEDQEIFEVLKDKKVIAVVNKIDLPEQKRLNVLEYIVPQESIVSISAKTRAGIGQLEKKIKTTVLDEELGEESVLITRLRHKRALEASLDALEKSRSSLERRESLELVTFDLKQALDALREFVGEIYSEDLLDLIFNEFCIGK